MEEKEFDYINVIPFVDIMLVLLTIVLTTATFIARGEIPVNIPEAKNREGESEPPVVITLTANGQLFINESEVRESGFEEDLDGYSSNSSILIRADKTVYIERLIRVIDGLKGKGFERVSMEVEGK